MKLRKNHDVYMALPIHLHNSTLVVHCDIFHVTDMAEPPKKLVRRPKFSDAEQYRIVQSVEERATIILGKLDSQLTAAMKNTAWEEVMQEVNVVARVKRTTEEVRRKFRDMRSLVKIKAAADTQHMEGRLLISQPCVTCILWNL